MNKGRIFKSNYFAALMFLIPLNALATNSNEDSTEEDYMEKGQINLGEVSQHLYVENDTI